MSAQRLKVFGIKKNASNASEIEMMERRDGRMRKLMVLGAGYPQVCLLKAARELGYGTVVCSIRGDYPGFSCADEVAYADISRKEEVLEAAKKYKVSGVATCCLDTGMRALGYTCEKLGFTGLGEQAAVCCADKWMMKKAFLKQGVHTAVCYYIKEERELKEVCGNLGFPFMMKAADLQGSKGVYICRTFEEAKESYKQVMALTNQDFCIAEEFLEGTELGAQAFVYQGRILFVLPHGDYTYMSSTAVPIGHYVPIGLPEGIAGLVRKEAERAIRAIGLDNCAVNIDLIEKDGKIYVIELTGRAGATCLPELVSIYYGVDYYKMIAAMAMGEDPRILFEKRERKPAAGIAMMLLSEQAGKVKKISDHAVRDEDVYEISLFVKEGDSVRKFKSAIDRIGQIIVKGANYEECRSKIEEIQNNIEIELE